MEKKNFIYLPRNNHAPKREEVKKQNNFPAKFTSFKGAARPTLGINVQSVIFYRNSLRFRASHQDNPKLTIPNIL